MLPAAIRGGIMGKSAAKIFGYILYVVLLIGLSQAYPAQQEENLGIPEICKQVEAYGNGQPHGLTIHKIRREFDGKYRETFGDVSDVVGEVFVDINNDGKPERVLLRNAGMGVTCGEEEIVVINRTTGRAIEIGAGVSNVVVDEDSKTNSTSYDFVDYQGTNYIVGRRGKALHYVAKVNSKNKQDTLCEFGQRERHQMTLLKSENDEVCKLAVEDKIKYVKYTKSHSLTYLYFQERGIRETYPREKAAHIDIDNDGKKELVVSVQLSSGSGQGCEVEYPQVLTTDRMRIDESYDKKLPGVSCFETIRPFVSGGKTYLALGKPYSYVEDKGLSISKVFMLQKETLQTVCEINASPINFVHSPFQIIEKAAGKDSQDVWRYAISQPGDETLTLLIRDGKDVNEVLDEFGTRPLFYAVTGKKDRALETLLKSGAEPNIKAYPAAVSRILQLNNDEYDEILEVLLWTSLVSKNDIDAKKRVMVTPLQWAIESGTEKAVSLLLKRGAKASDDAIGGYDAFFSAVTKGSLEKLQLLLDFERTIPDTAAIKVVTGEGSLAVDRLRLLINYGLDVNRNYTRDIIVHQNEQQSKNDRVTESKMQFRRVTKPLVEWAKESRDPRMVKIIRETQAKPSVSGMIVKLRGADADLNKTYKVQAEALSEGSREKLRKEQRTWIENRDTQCQSALPKSGMEEWLRFVAADEKRAQCVFEMTKKRTAELSAGASTGK